eukprot:6177054-Pleurochrysis_carterae.AAC.1
MDRYNSSGDETSATAPAAAPRHVAHTGAAEAPPPPPMSPPPRLAANERMSKVFAPSLFPVVSVRCRPVIKDPLTSVSFKASPPSPLFPRLLLLCRAA